MANQQLKSNMTQQELRAFLVEIYRDVLVDIRSQDINNGSLCFTDSEYDMILGRLLKATKYEKKFTEKLGISGQTYRSYISTILSYWIKQGYVFKNPTTKMCLLTSKMVYGKPVKAY